jgi:hypothetical protein
MARPKPEILMSLTDRETHVAQEVLAADAVWAVFCDHRPINCRTRNTLLDYPGPKYSRSVFANAGHAFVLNLWLNERFTTDRFDVYELGLEGGRLLKGDYPDEIPADTEAQG